MQLSKKLPLFLLCSLSLCLIPTRTFAAEASLVTDKAAIQAVEKAVRETSDKMTQAANSLNVDAFFEYILEAHKGLIIQNGTLFKTRQEAYEAVKRGFTGITKLERKIENPEVTVISPELALLTGNGKTTATLADGAVISNRFAVSLIFMLKDGQWKVLHGHYSMPIRM